MADKCDFCDAEHGTTHMTYVGHGHAVETSEDGSEIKSYSLSFLPDGIRFRLVRVASLAHAFKKNPIQTCEQCEKIVWAVLKELKKDA